MSSLMTALMSVCSLILIFSAGSAVTLSEERVPTDQQQQQQRLTAAQPADTQEVTVRTGEDVTLQCRVTTDASITLIEWNRTDLRSEEYVFFFRDNHLYKSYQLPSYRGRVELRDPETKNGDASVVLKNVTVNDTGTYECRVITDRDGRRRRNTLELLSTVKLKVEDSGHTAGNQEDGEKKEGGNLHIYLPVAAAIIIIIIVSSLVLWKCHSSMKKKSERPAADEAVELQTPSPPCEAV